MTFQGWRLRRNFGRRPVVRYAGIRALAALERIRKGVALNPRSAAFIRNPHRTYHILREKSPVHRSSLLQEWIVTRYDDIHTILRDPKRFPSNGRTTGGHATLATSVRGGGGIYSTFNRSIFRQEGPAHDRVRAILGPSFGPPRMEQLRPRIAAICDELLDGIADRHSADLVAELAVPLPLMVIAEMLGVPQDRIPKLRQWSLAMVQAADPLKSAAMVGGANNAAREATKFFRTQVRARRSAPSDDIIGVLADAVGRGELDEVDAVSTLTFLLIAGNETTTNLIGQSIRTILRHPSEMERLHSNPSLIPMAVEELLRGHSPVQGLLRSAAEDAEVGGQCLRQGDSVRLVFAAANRDPEQYTCPDRFDMDRPPSRHLAFGYGAHYCLGAGLARAEGQVVLERVLARFPGMRLAEARADMRPLAFIRGLQTLPVYLR